MIILLLPLEILVHITRLVDQKARLAWRLTCRLIHDAVDPEAWKGGKLRVSRKRGDAYAAIDLEAFQGVHVLHVDNVRWWIKQPMGSCIIKWEWMKFTRLQELYAPTFLVDLCLLEELKHLHTLTADILGVPVGTNASVPSLHTLTLAGDSTTPSSSSPTERYPARTTSGRGSRSRPFPTSAPASRTSTTCAT